MTADELLGILKFVGGVLLIIFVGMGVNVLVDTADNLKSINHTLGEVAHDLDAIQLHQQEDSPLIRKLDHIQYRLGTIEEAIKVRR